jgi:hypothetical protein
MPLEMAVVHKFRQRELRVWATPNLTPNVNPKFGAETPLAAFWRS